MKRLLLFFCFIILLGSKLLANESTPGSIVINEIMVNPDAAGIFTAEYVELYNTSEDPINLNGWTLKYLNTTMMLPDRILPPGGYAVIYRAAKSLEADEGGLAIPVANFPATLANAGNPLALRSPDNILIDSITYKNATSYRGCSWERDSDGNYYPSNDPRGGTPGSVNSFDSSASGDVWLNEIMVNPGTASVLTETEYVELYNPTLSAINLRGWTLVYEAKTVMILPGVILPPGGYAVLYRAGRTVQIDEGGIDIPVSNFPAFANTGRNLELKNSREVSIDAIDYPNSTALPGCSWERDGVGDLYPSSDPRGGTPGSMNSSDDSRHSDVRINEVMVNTNGAMDLPATEYVELYNTTHSDINLRGWTFIYASMTRVTLPDVLLPAGGYAVLYRAGKEIHIDEGGIAIPVANFPSTLANTGRSLELRNSRDLLIDDMTYPNSTDLPGCSWERDGNGNFYPSNDPRGGTPGSMNSFDNSIFGHVWINEIMVNPGGATGLPATEYVELYNPSNAVINLKGWTFVYNSSTVVTLPGILLPSGGYAVLYRAGKEIHIDEGGIEMAVANFPSTLANTGRLLELKNSRDILIDSVTYQNSTSLPGCSWERDGTGNFYPSNDPRGGTPGSVNSIDNSRFGNVWINEIMVNPAGATALAETEYVELYNTTHSALNLKGWTFIYDSRTVVTFPGVTLPSGGYAVLYRAGKDIVIDPGGIAISVANFPSTLANTGRYLELRNSRDVLIDSISYQNSTALPGCSWERDRAGNLFPSNDPRGGTPGSVNSFDDSRFGDVWINEIMVNPTGAASLPETEYVEFYNASSYGINMRGWTFIYDARTVVTLPGVILPRGGYAVLYRAGKDIIIDAGGIAIPVANFPATLANAGRYLELRNSRNILIDSVTYQNSANLPGCSWERDRQGDFYPSNDPHGGTPGSMNSFDDSRRGDLWINEIMVNPRGATLPETEYVELYNTSNSPVNLKGWTFIYDSRTVVTLPGVILRPGGYVVLYRADREIRIDAGGMAMPVANFPSTLANAGRILELRNSRDILIDSVTYQNSTNLPGRSWERDKQGNWYASNDPRGGTPGSANSPKDIPLGPDYSTYGDILINEVMADPRGLTAFPETEYVELYNASNAAVNLKGWSFIYDARVTMTLPEVTLPVNGYAVMYRAGKEIHIDQGGIAIPLTTFPTTLANAGRMLELKNTLGALIDSVTYRTARSAQSWERDSEGNLYLSNDWRGGTPGSVNSSKDKLPPEPDEFQYHAVWINEIMADPRGLTAFPETEYIELRNTTQTGINLKGWSLIYDERVTMGLPDIVLPADGFAVLYRTGKDIHIDKGGIPIPVTNFPATLANTGRHLQLLNQQGNLIDSITYQTARSARSWERDTKGSLYFSNDLRGGTPGAINSPVYNPDDPIEGFLFVYKNELVFNELLPEQHEGGSEYIELFNRSNRSLFLSGLSIATRRADGTFGTRYPLASIKEPIQPEEYVVLTPNREGVLNFYFTPAPHRIHEVRLPVLNNNGATLVLFQTNDETVIDEVSYSSRWHDPAIRNSKGVALERISPDTDTQNPANWTSATSVAGYGTPGYKNSQNRSHDLQESIQIGIPEYRDGFGDYTIRYQVDKSGYRCRLEVFSLEGKKVAEISNNQLMGFEGEISWSGFGIDGTRLRPGLYIFYSEIYHPDGTRKNDKNVFLMKP
jgi:hypothetical protein